VAWTGSCCSSASGTRTAPETPHRLADYPPCPVKTAQVELWRGLLNYSHIQRIAFSSLPWRQDCSVESSWTSPLLGSLLCCWLSSVVFGMLFWL
jgi:hypothetical protein